MGYLYTVGEICLVTGKTLGKQEYDTVSCAHCRAVIKLVLKGVTSAYETKFKCQHCRKPICRHCQETLGGVCSPDLYQIEHAIKHGHGIRHVAYRFKNYVFGAGR